MADKRFVELMSIGSAALGGLGVLLCILVMVGGLRMAAEAFAGLCIGSCILIVGATHTLALCSRPEKGNQNHG